MRNRFWLIWFFISILISDVQPDTSAKEDIIDVTEVAKNNVNSDSDIAENNEEYEESVSENENADLETSIDATTPVKVVQNFQPQLTAIEKLLLKGDYCSKFVFRKSLLSNICIFRSMPHHFRIWRQCL